MVTRREAGLGPCLLLICLFGSALPAGASEGAGDAFVGSGFPGFSLPAASRGLIEYDKEYYGKHNLVLTFFPAAFTPV